MKFCENGPNIPNSLIQERDAGKVVFICGAGVSMQSSGLPSFRELALKVMDELLVPKDDKIRESLNQSQTDSKHRLLSIDRIFSQLEQDYDTYDIEHAIAKILSISSRANTACHKIIYDLATTNDRTKLITTNFDDLFSRVANCSKVAYPNLDKIKVNEKFSYLVYLHGKCTEERISKEPKLVLSSRSFGSAYLLDGKINQLLQSIFSRFTVVFVGYSSDDPPIQYLLEALAQTDSSNYNVYAFHKKDDNSNRDKWTLQKIKPIYFSDYKDLWDTLSQWCLYSKNPESWINSVLKAAEKGPSSMADWQRSQVAYFASTILGMKAISEYNPPMPAQWLFCFDPEFRYAMTRPMTLVNQNYFDPFSALGLLEDALPPQRSLGDHIGPIRVKPNDAWDAFDSTGNYPVHPTDQNFSSDRSSSDHDIKKYNKYLSTWIASISDQAESVHWAVFRKKLNQDLRKSICYKITSNIGKSPAFNELGWKTIFENWALNDDSHEENFSQLEVEVKRHGWSPRLISKYKYLSKPLLTGAEAKRTDVISLGNNSSATLYNFIKVEPSYHFKEATTIESTKHTWELVKIERRNLDFVIDCRKHQKFYDEWAQLPLYKVSKRHMSPKSESECMPIIRYIERFKTLVEVNPSRAKKEFKSWPPDDRNIYGRLRIWAAGYNQLLSNSEAGDVFEHLPPELFWGRLHRKDLKYSLKARWNSLPDTTTDIIEKRVLRGCEPNVKVNVRENFEKSASLVIKFGSWMIKSGLNVSDKFVADISNLGDNYNIGKGTDKIFNYTDKDIQNIGEYKLQLKELRKKCKSQLPLMLIFLRRKSKSGDYPRVVWNVVLTSITNKKWKRRTILYTAMVLREAPDKAFEALGDYIIRWFSNVLAPSDLDNVYIRNEFFSRLVNMVKYKKLHDMYSEISKQFGEFRWMISNEISHSGLLASALFNYGEVKKYKIQKEDSIVPGFWFDAAAELLSMPGNSGRYALSRFMSEIHWLYKLAPNWVESHIFSKNLNSSDLTEDAFLIGLVSAREQTTDIDYDLYIKIKRHLVSRPLRPLASTEVLASGLTNLLIAGWIHRRHGERWISDGDFGAVLKNSSDRFRQCALVSLKNHLSIPTSDRNSNLVSDTEQFFLKVWPLTRSAKSEPSARKMLDIVFLSPESSMKISSIIIPRIGKFMHIHHIVKYLLDSHRSILSNYPDIAIKFIHLVFRHCPNNLSSETRKVINEVKESYPKIGNDIRFRDILKLLR